MTDPYGQQPYGQPSGQQPYGQPGYGPAGPVYDASPYLPAPPDNNLVWGILTTLLCCLPLGIVSIVKANQVNSLWAQGHYQAAREAAESAKKWAIWSAASWAILVVVLIVGAIIVAVLGAAQVSTTGGY